MRCVPLLGPLLAACAPVASPDASRLPVDRLPPDFAILLDDRADELQAGEDSVVVATGAPVGAQVALVVSLSEDGRRYCPTALGTCLDLFSPAFLVDVARVAADGSVRFALPVPDDVAPGAVARLQVAGLQRGAVVRSDVLTLPVRDARGLRVIHVSPAGVDGQDGTAARPVATLHHAIARLADAAPAEVRVAEGAYTVDSGATPPTHLQLVDGVSVLGGWSRDFTARAPSRYVSYVSDVATVVPPAPSPSSSPFNAVAIAAGAIGRDTWLDGLTLEGGTTGTSIALRVERGASPTVHDNVLLGGFGEFGARGVDVRDAAAPWIVGNRIVGASAELDRDVIGLVSIRGAALVEHNEIDGGPTLGLSRGVLTGGGLDVIRGNVIRGGSGSNSEAVAITPTGFPLLDNNLMLGGPARNASRGLFLTGRAELVHNLILGGSGDGGSVGVLGSLGSPVLVRLTNNLVGADPGSPGPRVCVDGAQPFEVFEHNALFGCPDGLWQLGATTLDLAGIDALDDGTVSGVFATGGNVEAAPIFTDPGAGDYRPAAGTPRSIAHGGVDRRQDVPVDLDGAPRTVPVSIGPYEVD